MLISFHCPFTSSFSFPFSLCTYMQSGVFSVTALGLQILPLAPPESVTA